MRLQENKQRLLSLGEKVTDAWLIEKSLPVFNRLKKIVSASVHSFPPPVGQTASIGSKRMMTGRMAFGQACSG